MGKSVIVLKNGQSGNFYPKIVTKAQAVPCRK